MSLTQALVSAISGLKVNQSALALVSANVANASTPGYVRKTATEVAIAGNGTGIGVRISSIQRQFDSYVQSQLWTENAGASYATTRANSLNQLQRSMAIPARTRHSKRSTIISPARCRRCRAARTIRRHATRRSTRDSC